MPDQVPVIRSRRRRQKSTHSNQSHVCQAAQTSKSVSIYLPSSEQPP